jgi:hypothetical protein
MEATAAMKSSNCFHNEIAISNRKIDAIFHISNVKNANNLVESDLDWKRKGLGSDIRFSEIILQPYTSLFSPTPFFLLLLLFF